MKPVFLVGFMCSGKTTLGEALARSIDVPYVDIDQAIERESGMSVSLIFSTLGEEAFRRMEAATLARLAGQHDVIIGCGGGTPCRPGAMQMMNAAGITVKLEARKEVLVRRLMEGRHKRPLVAAVQTPDEMSAIVDSLMPARDAYYNLAVHRFDSSYLESPEEIARSVEQFRREILNKE